MKKIVALILLITLILSFSGCSNKKQQDNAKDYISSFLKSYKKGDITKENCEEFIGTKEKSNEIYSLLIDEDFTTEKLRKSWGIDETVISDEKLSEISDDIRMTRLKRVKFNIKNVSSSMFSNNKVKVKVSITHPSFEGELNTDSANNLIYEAAGVKNYDELKNKFLEERNLTDEEIANYEQSKFEEEFFAYIINNYIPSALKKLITDAPLKTDTAIFTIKTDKNKMKTLSVKVK